MINKFDSYIKINTLEILLFIISNINEYNYIDFFNAFNQSLSGLLKLYIEYNELLYILAFNKDNILYLMFNKLH